MTIPATGPRYIGLRLLAAIVLLVGVLSLASCEAGAALPGTALAPSPAPTPPSADLAIYRGNVQRTGVYKSEAPPLNKQLWKYTTPDGVDTAPVVGDGVASFMVNNHGLYVLDVSTGALRWNADGYKYPPTLVDGLIYHTGNAGLRVQDIKTGQEKWVFRLEDAGAVASSPAIDHGVIYFGTSKGYFYALDPATKQQKWKIKIEDDLSTDPAIVDGMIYVAGDKYQITPGVDVINSERSLYALDQQTGKQVWQFIPPGTNDMPGRLGDPIVVDGVVYCASLDYGYSGPGHLYALDSKTGKQLWSYTPNQTLSFSDLLVVSDGLVYVVVNNGPLYAVDAKTGAERWLVGVGASATAPSLAGGVLYIGGGDALYALDAKTGKTLHKLAVGMSIVQPPVIADGVVYVVGSEGDLGNTIMAIR